MTKPLPGYVRVTHRLAMTNPLIASMPPEYIHRLVAEGAGVMLTEALLTHKVDTTAPFYIDAAVLQTEVQWDYDLQEIKLSLDYKERVPDRPQITLARPDVRAVMKPTTSG